MAEAISPAVETLRSDWRRMVGRTLPAAAGGHPEWPIRLDHCFARVILDTICGAPWRQSIAAPAWRNMSEAQLTQALAWARRILGGEMDLAALNATSLRLRGKSRGA